MIPPDILVISAVVYVWGFLVVALNGQFMRREGGRQEGAWFIILSPLWPVALVAVPFAILWLLGLGAVRTAKWLAVLFRDAAGRTR